MTRLKKNYNEKIKKALQEKFGYRNIMMIPRLKKVVINMGVAKVTKDKNIMQALQEELGLISGQKPVLKRAKKSISNFKLREGQPIGIMVTLRGKRMYDFCDRFFNITIPHIHDFRGFSPKGDGRGNYTLGITEQAAFQELNLDKVTYTQGMTVTFVTDAETDAESIELLRQLGMPFKDQPVAVNA